METYYIAETQNLNSVRTAEKIEVKSLTAAKINASKNQVFEGTTLSIFADVDENGYGVDLIASKDTGYSNRNIWA